MTKKAQEIRKNRKAMIDQEISAEAEKIFNWILDLIDADTEKNCFRDFKLYLFDDELTLRTEGLKGTEYNLNDFFLRHDRIELFEVLKEIIEREEGFTANFKRTKFWDYPCIMFKIVID